MAMAIMKWMHLLAILSPLIGSSCFAFVFERSPFLIPQRSSRSLVLIADGESTTPQAAFKELQLSTRTTTTRTWKRCATTASCVELSRGGDSGDDPKGNGNGSDHNKSGRSNNNQNKSDGDGDSLESLFQRADQMIKDRKLDDAFSALADIYAADPNATGLSRRFESLLRLKVDLLSDEYEAALALASTSISVTVADDDYTTIRNNKDDVVNMNKLRFALCQERMGMGALLIDRESYEDASVQLRSVVSDLSASCGSNSSDTLTNENEGAEYEMFEKAACMLYRTQAASCNWTDAQRDSEQLASFLRRAKENDAKDNSNRNSNSSSDDGSASHKSVPPIHPFEALKWPCVSLESATFVAHKYSNRAASLVATQNKAGTAAAPDCAKANKKIDGNKIRLGYISPDFTGTHPLAFLMQHMFRMHNSEEFEVFIYSLAKPDGSPEVQAIQKSVAATNWVELASYGNNATAMAKRIQQDNLDTMVDLCGHSGTSTIMELMAHRVAPAQISYMGFPGSTGASYIDYLVCDETVVPSATTSTTSEDKLLFRRQHYTETLILMPHCYFVNSHKTLYSNSNNNNSNDNSISIPRYAAGADSKLRRSERRKYGLPASSFVFCCHSRPDKINPITFRSWMTAMQRLRLASSSGGSNEAASAPGDDNAEDPSAVLWLLRSGSEMEHNLRTIAQNEYGLDPSRCLVFCDVAPRDEHVQRLALADVFLDTPAYNAHTVGCDCLWAGVPMISLLLPPQAEEDDNTNTSISSSTCTGTLRTDKLPSRVGASLLKACGLEDMIASSMQEYENLMWKCATDQTWFRNKVRVKLDSSALDESPLFDTARWVKNLETGLKVVASRTSRGKRDGEGGDIIVPDYSI
jgi:predicted O-linked N-acetylglucosamine transferase (SPINDLY family)